MAPRNRPARVLGAGGGGWDGDLRHRRRLWRPERRLADGAFRSGWSRAVELRHPLGGVERARGRGQPRRRRRLRRRRDRAPAQLAWVAEPSGSCTSKVAPPPEVSFTCTRPPCAATTALTIDSPRPAPPLSRLRLASAL